MIEALAENLPFVVAALLLAIGLYALLFKSNLIKMAIGLSIMGSAANLFLVALGYRQGSIAPIFTNAPKGALEMAMPVPQALTLTSIVIGLAVTALMLSLAVLFYKHHGTLNAKKAWRLKK